MNKCINIIAVRLVACLKVLRCYYTPRNEVGYIGFTLSLSVCPLTFRVRPEASTVLDGFFPYVVQMINSMSGRVLCDDPWPWHIYSRSFGLDLENRVRSVSSTLLDGKFLYLARMITIIRECVACYVFIRSWKFEFLAILKKKSALTLEKNYCSRWILSILSTDYH